MPLDVHKYVADHCPKQKYSHVFFARELEGPTATPAPFVSKASGAAVFQGEPLV